MSTTVYDLERTVNSELIFFSKSSILFIKQFYLSKDPLFLIFFCNCKIPYNNASAEGGQPGT